MKKIFLTLVLATAAMCSFAQRVTDKIDRGLVAVPAQSGGGNFVSWRVFGEEYYDVTYNLYCNGSKIASNLTTSSYNHTSGNATSQYQVAAVVRGVEKEKCAAIKRWDNQYLEIKTKPITGRDGTDVTANYTLNDISLGDLDGDGVVEFIIKRPCSKAADTTNKNCFHVLDCYDLKGNRLWWIDLGPNMLSGADEQWDCVCYDWDGDGKAEVLLRIQDNAYIHYNDGTSLLIGSNNVDLRWSGIEYTSDGNEYLLYLEGATGKPYPIGENGALWMTYPLARGKDSDWGSGIVGHRSTKHFFAAPYLDGRKPSIFLGRGAYTKHLMAAYDVDPATHKLTQRWYWENTVGGPWFGQGYHNFAVGDVDWDGRDEIIFGSMVIDDNGKGLSTTGLGHGDAQHCSDFDPYRKYSEFYACNESSPNMNYRNAATSELYYRRVGGSDDGRALMGNFSNAFPGSMGRSVNTGLISSVADKEIQGGPATGGTNDGLYWSHLNGRIYWTGDLIDGIFDSPGTEREAVVWTTTGGRVFQSSGCALNNSSKNNACALGDIIGDWREEIVVRTTDNASIRVYTTNYSTKYRIPTLWHDHQYRNAMVWQSIGYNQPPHKSYFLGEMEGITVAPPPYTMTDRTEVKNGGTITTTDDHLIVCETNNTNISIQNGASPYMVTFNVPSWVQGTAGNNVTTKDTEIKYEYFTCNVTGGALTGSTRVVKQGDGILTLPKADMTYTGETNIWAGTLNFDGTLKNSPLWLNRFAELNSNGGVFKSIKADYASVIRPGGEDKMGSITVEENLDLGFGSRIVIDLYSDGLKADQINVKTLNIERKTDKVWIEYGPEYLQPVIEFVGHYASGSNTHAIGDYNLGKVENINGSLSDIKLEGTNHMKVSLAVDDDHNLILSVEKTRDAADIVWAGSASNEWNLANEENFYLSSDKSKNPEIFVAGDNVSFTDDASVTAVNISDDITASTITVNSSKNYTFSGTGAITGGSLVKEGKGTLTISTDNTYTGGTYLKGGTVVVSSLSNALQAKGNLGAVNTDANKFTMENGAVLQSTATVTNASPIKFIGDEGGVINNPNDFVQNAALSGTVLTKKGNGWLKTSTTGASLQRLIIEAGTVQNNSGIAAQTVEFQGGSLVDGPGTNNTLFVDKGKKGTFTTSNRQNYSNKITGEGELTIYCASEEGSGWYATRTQLQFDLSGFSGTIIPQPVYAKDGRFTLNTSKGSQNMTLNIPAGVYVQNRGLTLRIGQITGSGTLGGWSSFANGESAGTNTWQVGNDNNFTFAGKVTSGDRFTKMGNGTMTVSGSWDMTGAVTVSAGELSLRSGKLGTGTLTVDANGTLSGVTKSGAPLTNSSITVNGTLSAGNSTGGVPTGFIDFGGKNVTLGAKSKIVVGLRATVNETTIRNTYFTNVGTLKLNNGATIEAYLADSYKPTTDETAPDSFYVWTDAKRVTVTASNLNLVLPELPVYNYWDTSRIAEGILYVRCDKEKYDAFLTDIKNIEASETVSVEIINASGAVVGTFTSAMSDVQPTFSKQPLPKGVYLLQVKSETGKRGTLKLMK